MNRLFSALVIVVLLLLFVAAGLFFYQSYGHPGQFTSVATNEAGPPAFMPGGDETVEAPSGESSTPAAEQPAQQPDGAAPAETPDTGKAALLPMPSIKQRPETITQYALSSLPGWQSKIVTHDPEYRSATVRATSPDGKVSLDVDVKWDKELGDYTVTDASAAGAAKATAAVPKGIVDALDANAKLRDLPDRKVTVRRLTSSDATVLVQSDIKKWRVYLKQKGGHWTIVKAKEL